LNQKHHGLDLPPDYDLSKISSVKLVLVTGKKDLVASPDDYNWLKGQLVNNEDTEMWEYDLGHTGLLIPEDKKHIKRIFRAIKAIDGMDITEEEEEPEPVKVTPKEDEQKDGDDATAK